MAIVEFPYNITITKSSIDDSVYPPVEVTVTILDSICDISAPTDSKPDGVYNSDYSVWLPAETVLPKLQRGTRAVLKFSATNEHNVEIANTYPGQLGSRIDVKEVDQ